MPATVTLRRLTELGLLFGVLPWWWSSGPVRAYGIWPPIILGFLGCLVYLLCDRGFDRSRLWNMAGARRGIRLILARFALGAALLTLATYLFERELFFAFPRQNPAVWAMVMCFYPVLSVYPQEVIFRAFFVQRYGDALRRLGGNTALVIVAAAAFGWAHVIFGTALAVILSGVGGVLFTQTYLRTKSTAAASLEHALFGDLLFTVGLGWYFYSGSIGATAAG